MEIKVDIMLSWQCLLSCMCWAQDIKCRCLKVSDTPKYVVARVGSQCHEFEDMLGCDGSNLQNKTQLLTRTLPTSNLFAVCSLLMCQSSTADKQQTHPAGFDAC